MRVQKGRQAAWRWAASETLNVFGRNFKISFYGLLIKYQNDELLCQQDDGSTWLEKERHPTQSESRRNSEAFGLFLSAISCSA